MARVPLVRHRLEDTPVGRASGLAVGRSFLDAAVEVLRGTVDLLLKTLRSVPTRLLGNCDVALVRVLTPARRLGAGPSKVARNEELDEQVGQRREVKDIEPDGKSLAGGVDTGDELVRVDGLLGCGGLLNFRVSS